MGRRGIAWVVGAVVLVAVMGAGAVWMMRPAESAPLTSPPPTLTAERPTPAAAPEPTSTPTGFPENTTAYDLSTLPASDVFSVIPAVLVDDAPYGSFTGEVVRAREQAVPVFADPLGAPVSLLLRDYVYGGTTVPVVERQEHWVKVLLTGRHAVPSQGDPGQVAGWVRAGDVESASLDTMVEVSISARTVDVWRGGVRERVATDFAWGTATTPTPLGRSFVMHVGTDPELWYTRGHPIVYLSVQSPTLDGFGGSSVAVTAFHYHDAHSGPISNGCLRMSADAISALAALAVGTPVYVRS